MTCTGNATPTQSKPQSGTPKSSTIGIASKVRYQTYKKNSLILLTPLSNNTGLTAYSLHPGLIQTNLQGKDPSWLGTLLQFSMKITPTVTPLEGSLTSLFAATSPEAPGKAQGRFILPVGKVSKSVDKWLEDRQGNWELWDWSERVVGRV
jgi:hypothetical protein